MHYFNIHFIMCAVQVAEEFPERDQDVFRRTQSYLRLSSPHSPCVNMHCFQLGFLSFARIYFACRRRPFRLAHVSIEMQ